LFCEPNRIYDCPFTGTAKQDDGFLQSFYV
jgi:hypothetical protein